MSDEVSSQDLTIDDLAPKVAEMGPEELDALEAEEKEGKERVGVFELITARRETLDADDEDETESADPTEEELAAAERAKVEAAASAPRDPDDVDDEEYDVLEAPVDEIKPVIRVGDWVTLGRARGVPSHLVNKDAVVVTAVVRHSEGGDELSPAGYEYQLDSDEFFVKVRETGTTLTVTRGAVINHGTQQAELGFRS